MTIAGNPSADDQGAVLREWATELSARLALEGAVVDVDAILAIAGRAAHAVIRPAAPLTTYLVGYAAGAAAARGSDSGVAFTSAAQVALGLAAERSGAQRSDADRSESQRPEVQGS